MAPEARLIQLREQLADLRWSYRSGDIDQVEFARRFRQISIEESAIREKLPIQLVSIVVPPAGH